MTRRSFLMSAPVAAASTQLRAAASPNDRIRIALIGAGGMGCGDAESSLKQAGVELAAVADVYSGRLTHAREAFGPHIFTTRDYREVLARKDIDAVIVATPDHWHAPISIAAMQAGKDVYCEKPMVHDLAEGRSVLETQRRTGHILQVGSQRVSSVVYAKAKEWMAAGKIGELNMVEAWWDRNSAQGAWIYSIPPDATPETIDWDRFLGNTPKVPFDPVRLFRWRNYRDYGTGVAGDLFVHLFSGMHFITGAVGPSRVFATGGLRFWKDREVPDVMLGTYDYDRTDTHPAFNLALRVNFVNGAGETSGFRFVGSEGVMTIGWEGLTLTRRLRPKAPGYNIETFARATQEEFLRRYEARYPKDQQDPPERLRPPQERFAPPKDYDDHLDHHRNFIDAVRSRKPVVEDAAFGLRAAGPALLSNISYFENRVCLWDPYRMTMKR